MQVPEESFQIQDHWDETVEQSQLSETEAPPPVLKLPKLRHYDYPKFGNFIRLQSCRPGSLLLHGGAQVQLSQVADVAKDSQKSVDKLQIVQAFNISQGPANPEVLQPPEPELFVSPTTASIRLGRLPLSKGLICRSQTSSKNTSLPQVNPSAQRKDALTLSRSRVISTRSEDKRLRQLVQDRPNTLCLESMEKLLVLAETSLRNRLLTHLRNVCASMRNLDLLDVLKSLPPRRKETVAEWLYLLLSTQLLLAYSTAEKQAFQPLYKSMRNAVALNLKNCRAAKSLIWEHFVQGRHLRNWDWQQFISHNSIIKEILAKSWSICRLQGLPTDYSSTQACLLLNFSELLYEKQLQFKLPFLAKPPAPFLEGRKGCSLAINPILVLVYSTRKEPKQIRLFEGAAQFIQTMSVFFNVVLYADISRERMVRIAETLAPPASALLWRTHYSLANNRRVLDARDIGYQFESLILVDCNEDTWRANRPNSLLVRHKSPRSEQLWKLLPLLVEATQRNLPGKEAVQFVRSIVGDGL